MATRKARAVQKTVQARGYTQMATNTFMTFLMHATGEGNTYSKLVDIISYPDLGGSREALDTTTLSDRMYTFIQGIEKGEESLEFPINYTPEVYKQVKALANKDEKFAVWFGGTDDGETVTPKGDLGKFEFTGMADIKVTGAGVNEVRKATIQITPTKPISFSTVAA